MNTLQSLKSSVFVCVRDFKGYVLIGSSPQCESAALLNSAEVQTKYRCIIHALVNIFLSFNKKSKKICFCLPLVTVGEFHVHAVSAQEGLAVQRRVDVGRVWNRFAHQDSACERRLFEAAQHSWRAAVVHPQLSSAVEHLRKSSRSADEVYTVSQLPLW